MRGKIFEKKERQRLLTRLYNAGMSITIIAERFNCNHATILYWKERLKLFRPFRAKRKKKERHFIYPKYDYMLHEEINKGKDYKEYLKEKGLKLKHNSFGEYAIKDDIKQDCYTPFGGDRE